MSGNQAKRNQKAENHKTHCQSEERNEKNVVDRTETEKTGKRRK
jgi:hypothetical protein